MESPVNKTEFYSQKFKSESEEVEFFRQRELYRYVPEDNKYMQLAKRAAAEFSKTADFPIGIVAIKNGEVVSEAGNGNGYHEEHENTPGHKGGCVRKFLRQQARDQGLEAPKGLSHDLCPGCHTDSHAEANLIKNAKNKEDLRGAEVYMYGHFWCCKSCWNKMKQAGIKDVFLPEDNMKFDTKEGLAEWIEEYKKMKNES